MVSCGSLGRSECVRGAVKKLYSIDKLNLNTTVNPVLINLKLYKILCKAADE